MLSKPTGSEELLDPLWNKTNLRGSDYDAFMTRAAIKPTHKAIQTYYDTLRTYADQHVEHEWALETAFSRLLADTAKPHGWTLIAKLGAKALGKHIIPDGTLRDGNTLPRGHWEAKDTGTR